ncbi:MAG: CotH kinase family protein [Prolixibacteraceae bacterium]|jgi:hypothetical protein|nr:CotH kinase family protein [Prolixibacteraceae bacterium]
MFRTFFILITILAFYNITYANINGNQTSDALSEKLLISEFMAVNNSTFQDEDGDFSDWIEIHNPGTESINLKDWSLTDNPNNLFKWQFPTKIIGPGEYLVVFASDKNRRDISSNLHTNFKLSGSGEYLALTESDMKTISYAYPYPYPAQQKDISYGLLNGLHVFFETPTPGEENAQENKPVSPAFSHERGYYTTPITVTLQSPYPNSTIYYTTDGSHPTKATGTKYENPITINKTTPLSTIIIKDDISSNIKSHTYWFIADLVQQSQKQEGYPNEWSKFVYEDKRAPSDYEMDPEICNSAEYKDQMNDAFLSIPSISIVTDKDFLFSHELDHDRGGIYIFTGKSGDGSTGLDWERPTSAEYFDPENGSNFHVNCILQLHGGNSRVPENSQKHSFRLEFKSNYGFSKLKFNLFDNDRDPVNEFNSIVLRAGYNYSWMKNGTDQNKKADYLRDPFTKNTQLDMGHPSAHSKFVHLYLNGLYWGVYTLSEKITDDFMETYMHGDEEDWDVVKDHNGTTDGTRVSWNRLMSLAKNGLSSNAAYQKLLGNNADGTPNASYEKLLDPINFTDYILLNFYIGNKDWDGNNWLAARNRVDPLNGFRLFAWDAETSMLNVNENIVSLNDGEPTKLFNYLLENYEYKMLVADRIQKHFFNNGALTPEATTKRYDELANKLDPAIICESARWGDYRRDVHVVDNNADLYTRNDHWLVEIENQRNNYLPYRTDKVVQQLRNRGIFPSLKAPLLSNYGEEVKDPIEFFMENPNSNGTIYYTTDGTDPRDRGDLIASSAFSYAGNSFTITGAGIIKARVYNGSKWSPLSEADFESKHSSDFIVSSHEIAYSTVKCYPNPVTSRANLIFEMQNPAFVNIEITSIDGRIAKLIFNGNLAEGLQNISWDAQGLKNGIYFYHIRNETQTISGKIIIAK